MECLTPMASEEYNSYINVKKKLKNNNSYRLKSGEGLRWWTDVLIVTIKGISWQMLFRNDHYLKNIEYKIIEIYY